jgi:hypothetical protein
MLPTPGVHKISLAAGRALTRAADALVKQNPRLFPTLPSIKPWLLNQAPSAALAHPPPACAGMRRCMHNRPAASESASARRALGVGSLIIGKMDAQYRPNHRPAPPVVQGNSSPITSDIIVIESASPPRLIRAVDGYTDSICAGSQRLVLLGILGCCKACATFVKNNTSPSILVLAILHSSASQTRPEPAQRGSHTPRRHVTIYLYVHHLQPQCASHFLKRESQSATPIDASPHLLDDYT